MILSIFLIAIFLENSDFFEIFKLIGENKFFLKKTNILQFDQDSFRDILLD